MYKQNQDQVKTIELVGVPRAINFAKHRDQGNPFSIELELEGRTKQHFSLIISNPDGPVHTARVKGGNASFTYVSDWYSDSVKIELLPEKGEKGKLTVKCRFIAI
jgi:hypothetical protein